MMRMSPELESYWSSLEEVLPTFDREEQRAAVALYRALARGRPVSAEDLAGAHGVSVERARTLLDRPSIRGLVFADEGGRVAGFGGLATSPMAHELELEGRTLWAWCAWDTLFLPGILGARAEVRSRDPRSGAVVRLSVAPEGVLAREPESIVVSFVAPDAERFRASATNVMASFCHYVFFFESRASGRAWSSEHPGTFLVSLDDAAELARRLNTRSWGDALEGSAAGRARSA